MSGSHDTHHSGEQKPVAFTVPLIMAAVLVLIIILFLSLCDPKPHHHGDAAHEGPHGTEAMHHDAAIDHHEAAAPAHHDATAAEEVHADSTGAASAESHEPEAEPAGAHH